MAKKKQTKIYNGCGKLERLKGGEKLLDARGQGRGKVFKKKPDDEL